MLTVEILKKLQPGQIFARGFASDDECGINMSRSHKCLRWIAKRGEGIPDWAIYIHFAKTQDIGFHPDLHGTSQEDVDDFVERVGDKVCNEHHIKKLVPCDAEAFAMYRY